MDSPYKKLFSGGVGAGVSPASAKKLRKHPIYFTAKIDIDEVQQHHEVCVVLDEAPLFL